MGEGRKRVLLVEDHPEVLEFFGELLGQVGYDVDRAATYSEGMRKLVEGQHELLIADVLLPGGSGTALAETAKRKGLKTLLVTGPPEIIQRLELEDEPFIRKPSRPSA